MRCIAAVTMDLVTTATNCAPPTTTPIPVHKGRSEIVDIINGDKRMQCRIAADIY